MKLVKLNALKDKKMMACFISLFKRNDKMINNQHKFCDKTFISRSTLPPTYHFGFKTQSELLKSRAVTNVIWTKVGIVLVRAENKKSNK